MKYSRLIFNMSSEKYHSTPETVSSSQIKDLLDDPEVFYKKYIAKEIPRLESAAFDVGNYVHTAVLEPEKLKKDIAVYPGKVRHGKAWELFKKKNAGKLLVTPNQKAQAEQLIANIKRSPISMKRLAKGKSEVSLFIRLAVTEEGEIYAIDHNKKMTINGWVEVSAKEIKAAKSGTLVVIKTRADRLSKTYILDLKTTTGNTKSKKSMRAKISHYDYDLSCSLYLDMFSLVLEDLKDFIWTFTSKDFNNAKSWKASPRNIKVGRAKWMKGIQELAKNMRNGWKFEDTMGVLEPETYQLEWLESSAEEIL